MKRYIPFIMMVLAAALMSASAVKESEPEVLSQTEGHGHQMSAAEEETSMKIRVISQGKVTIFRLNESRAAKELLFQLPLTVEVQNFSNDEKIFYPPEKLTTDGTPQADARAGTLAYYAPWGDVVMFYEDFGKAGGLYELGLAVSGSDHIRNMSGTITIEQDE